MRCSFGLPGGELRGDPPPHLGPVLIDESHVRGSLRERIEEIRDYWRDDRSTAGPKGVEVAVRALASDVTIR